MHSEHGVFLIVRIRAWPLREAEPWGTSLGDAAFCTPPLQKRRDRQGTCFCHSDLMTTTSSSNTDAVPPGLSYEPDSANSANGANGAVVTMQHSKRAVALLSDLDGLMERVARCMEDLRENAEACKRRRDLLDFCARSNLFETPDGQFSPMTNDTDRCHMLATIFEADQEYSDSKLMFQVGFTKTIHGLRFIVQQNTTAATQSFGVAPLTPLQTE